MISKSSYIIYDIPLGNYFERDIIIDFSYLKIYIFILNIKY